MKNAVAAVLVTTALTTISPTWGRPQNASARFERAIELSDINSDKVSPFRLKATVSVSGKTEPVRGTYELISLSEHRWREEIVFPGYRRVRVGGVGKYWQSRNIDFELARIFQLTEAIDFASRLESDIRNTIGKSKTEKNNGKEMSCISVEPFGLNNREVCFDVETGTLDLEKLSSSKGIVQDEISAREYADYAPFGKKLFPHTIRVLQGSKPLITIAVDELVPISDGDSSAFEPPKDAQVWETCRFPQPAKLVSSVPPRYPPTARLRMVSGVVRVYAVIGVDGYLHDLKMLESPDPDLTAAGLEALRHWKYQPPSCDGQPIRIETFVDMVFALGH